MHRPIPQSSTRLGPSEGITDGDGERRNDSPAILLVQIIYPVNIELRLDEYVRFEVELHAHGAVHLEMIRTGNELTLTAIQWRQAILGCIKGQFCAANSPLDDGNDALIT